MEVSLYHTRGTFEFLPALTLTHCYSDKLQKGAYTIAASWGTIVFEIAWEF